MKPLALALLAILLVVSLRPREPDRAVMRPRRQPLGPPSSGNTANAYGVMWIEPDDGMQPSDPYPASLLR